MKDFTTTQLVGLTDAQMHITQKESPEYFESFGDDDEVKSFLNWSHEDTTQQELVNIAIGRGDDTDEFELTDEHKMLVVANTMEPIETVSNRFNLVDNQQVLSVLKNVIEDMNLQQSIRGEGRVYREKNVVDLFFVGEGKYETGLPSDTANFTLGLKVETGNDGRSSIKVAPLIRENETNAIFRQVGDGWESIRHVKDTESEKKELDSQLYRAFVEKIHDLGKYRDTFQQDVKEAAEYTIDFEKEDFTIQEFFEYWLSDTQMPKSVVEAAPRLAQVNAGLISAGETPSANPELSAFNLLMGATLALNDETKVADGVLKDTRAKIVSKMLVNPDGVFHNTLISYRKDQEEEPETDGALSPDETSKRASELATAVNEG